MVVLEGATDNKHSLVAQTELQAEITAAAQEAVAPLMLVVLMAHLEQFVLYGLELLANSPQQM
jgi:hypothetical protein